MSSDRPLVSIGLPVYNGEQFLKQALDSILAQTFQDFELVISDNASTDNTGQICKEYAARDHRIIYHRLEKNITAPENFNRVFNLASGQYFKWAADDDLLAPTYLEKCVDVLNGYSSVVLCHCITGRIDEKGVLLGIYNQGMLTRIDSGEPHERFGDLLGLVHAVCPLLGVGRSSAFAKTPLQGGYVASDRTLLAEMGLLGKIKQVPECLFFLRDHPGSYSSKYYGNNRPVSQESMLEEMAWWSKGRSTYFPHWKVWLEYFRSVRRVSMPRYEKLLSYNEIFRWVMKEGYLFLWNDLKVFLLWRSKLARKFIPPLLLRFGKPSVGLLRQMR